MSPRHALLPLLPLFAVAACDQSQPTEPAAPAAADRKVVVQGPGQRAMHGLGELNRAIALKRAIYASGSTCKRITRSGYVSEYGNLSMWAANCDDGRDWAVFIGPNDDVQVRPCQDMEQLKLPRCEIDWSKTRR